METESCNMSRRWISEGSDPWLSDIWPFVSINLCSSWVMPDTTMLAEIRPPTFGFDCIHSTAHVHLPLMIHVAPILLACRLPRQQWTSVWCCDKPRRINALVQWKNIPDNILLIIFNESTWRWPGLEIHIYMATYIYVHYLNANYNSNILLYVFLSRFILYFFCTLKAMHKFIYYINVLFFMLMFNFFLIPVLIATYYFVFVP